jgi:hypothetical protein
LEKTFGGPDAKRVVELKLARLKQTGSVSKYTTEFRQVTIHLEYDDEPLMMLFYRGLKEEVKDDLIREKRPDEFTDYVEMAVAIDNRLYERRMEKRM